MDRVAVYELEKKRKGPLYGGYYYDWGEKNKESDYDTCFGDDEYTEVDEKLEKLQELHMFNR